MSSSYSRQRSPPKRRDSDRYNQNGYDRHSDRHYDDYRARSKRLDREDEKRREMYRRESDAERRQQRESDNNVINGDTKMEQPEPPKKKVPVSIEELLKKKEQEQKETEKPKFLTKEERAKIALEKRQKEQRMNTEEFHSADPIDMTEEEIKRMTRMMKS
ncbi:hypothetical protein G6F43_010772 [Rhizopus delemar]|nr:hypothetical protein G6F43_010772 [Rhizopus delemar]